MSPSIPEEHILATQEGAVLTLTINRPDKRNALTVAMYERLLEGLERADRDPSVRVVVVTGQGGVFTAGNDIHDFMNNPALGEESAVFRLLLKLASFPKPLVAKVPGLAVGVGTTMLLQFDLVYAASGARFQLPFVNLGLVPEGASTLLLPLLCGLQRASEHLLLGEPVTAEEARELGLVCRVVPVEELDGFVAKQAAALAAKPPVALGETKRLLREPLREAIASAMHREGTAFVKRLGSPEALEAFSAFLEKRKPNFGSLGG